MATVLSLSAHLSTFHVHKRLFLLLSAPLPTSAPLYLIPPFTFHVFCPHGSPASCLSSVPSSFHERHMLPSASVRSETQREGILFFKMLLSGKRTFFSLLSHASLARPSRPDAPERRHIPGSGLTCPHVWL